MNFTFNGSKRGLEDKLTEFLRKNDAEKFIDGLEKYAPFINGEEYIETTLPLPKAQPGLMQLLIASKNYNINLKTTTIVSLLLLLDIATLGISDRLLSWAGIDIKNQGLCKVSEENGEKCIIAEMLRLKPHVADLSILPPINLECINNHFNCSHRHEGKCCIDENNVNEILINLCEKNVLRKHENQFMYNF